MAVLLLPVVLPNSRAPLPTAVLAEPVVLEANAPTPIAVLMAPVVFDRRASVPKAVLKSPAPLALISGPTVVPSSLRIRNTGLDGETNLTERLLMVLSQSLVGVNTKPVLVIAGII